MVGAILAALSSAFCFALAAALQHREALGTKAAGVADIRLLWRLCQRPLWLAGVAADLASMALHVLALSMASLALVQPLGVTGIVFAIPLAALLRRQRIRRLDLLAAGLVVGGLIALLHSLPTSSVPHLPPAAHLVLSTAVALAAAAAATTAAHHLPGRPRAVLLAGAAGTAFGLTAVLVRTLLLLSRLAGSAPSVVITSVCIAVLGLGGYLLLQSAYRSGHFAGSLATSTVLDPVVAVVAGHLLLGEVLPTDPARLVVIGIAVALVVTGVAALVRSPAAMAVLASAPTPAADLVAATVDSSSTMLVEGK
jgi:drug/metabolite transporter (DMT)-like permease